MVKVVDEGTYQASRDKVWKLIEAHGNDIMGIHSDIKSTKLLRKEGGSDVIENETDMGGQLVKSVVKVTPNPPNQLTLDFLEGAMTGKIVNTYSDIPGGTKVTTEADMTSPLMNDDQLRAAVLQRLSKNFEEDTRYLSKL